MPNTIGQSEATIDKQNKLYKIFEQHFAACREIYRKYSWVNTQYQYIDMNAGCGYNEVVDMPGSPIIFLECARGNMNYQAHFIEQSATNCLELRIAVGEDIRHRIYTDDNARILPDILSSITPQHYGLVYTDPNGVPNFDLLADAFNSSNVKRIDLLIRYNGAATKRILHYTHTRFLDYLKCINKSHWIVSEIDGKQQWSFLLGMNWDGLKAMRNHGFYHITSPQGQEIVRQLHYTRKELKKSRQPFLTGIMENI